MNEIELSGATLDDLPAIRALLAQCLLSDDGIEGLVHMCVVAKAGSRLVGTIALEPCGQAGLLRSLAVAPDARGHLIGQSLCGRVISHARMLGIERLYLLTTDAERYFTRLHFERIARSQAPPQIQATTQFRSLCPASAVCMARDLSGEVIHASNELL